MSEPAPNRSASGFALLITITLVAFLVLVLVALATVTRVETRVAANSQLREKARGNALMALNVALGQLQRYTGPDQRVTAVADIAAAADGGRLPAGEAALNTTSVNGTGNGLGSVRSGTRWWTGVWGSAGGSYATPAKSIYEETPSPVLLNWLVSGNEDRTFTVDSAGLVATSAADGSDADHTAPFTPGNPVDWAGAGLDPNAPGSWDGGNGYADLKIKSAGDKAVLLVGPATAGTESMDGDAAVERYVVAPLRDIEVRASEVPGMGGSGTVTVGRYAWWVGDEGVKASYAISDPHAGKNSPAGTDSDAAEARVRLMSSSRSGVELVTGYSAYPKSDDETASRRLGRLLRMDQAPLLDSSLESETQRAGIHDFATMSGGVLSDSLNGGLRKDLTHYFEMSRSEWESSDLAGQGIIPAPYSPDWGTPGRAPKWDWLYSFYNTNPSVASASLQMRPETATEVGVGPVITQFRMILSTDADAMQQTVPNIKYLGSNKSYQLPIRCNVVFVLANPYDVTLTAPAGALEFTVRNGDTQYPSHAYPEYALGGEKSYGNKLVVVARKNNADKAVLNSLQILRAPDSDDPDGVLDTVRFVVPALSIPPGETVTLSVAGNGQVLTNANGVDADPSNTVNLEVNDGDNAVDALDKYFTAQNTLDFTTPSTDGLTTVSMYNVNTASITITLRAGGTGEVYQKINDCRFSKPNQVASYGDTVIGSAQIRLIGPALRKVNWPSPTSFTFSMYAEGRVYADYNIRAGVADHPNITPIYNLLACPPYGAGTLGYVSGGSASPITTAFTQDLHPAPWAEDFTPGRRSGAGARGVFFDFPRRAADQLPVLSLGQLQHASLGTDDVHPGVTVNYQPAYAVGNSYHHPHVTRGAVVQSRNNRHYKAGSGTTRYFDLSYLLNASLWDGCYFSGIPQTGTSAEPQNPRYRVYDQALPTELRDRFSSSHLLVNGAFNINSTSRAAWVALLGGLNRLRVNDDPADQGVPFPRGLWQPEANTLTGSSYTSSGTGDDAYSGYRRLSGDEIERLSEEIVRRVRARGPFTSLAHFVNRSLVPASDAFNPTVNDADPDGNLAAPVVPMGRGLSGPLQAAIDSAAAGINTYQTVGGDMVSADGAGNYGDRVLFNGETVPTGSMTPSYSAGSDIYFADRTADKPSIEWNIDKKAPPGPAGRTSTAIPGWLLQGDVLQALGSALSARSDTFVIRAYGEAVDPTDASQRQAGAWCEAVVQRLPGYVAPDENDADASTASLSATNRTFGRAYKVVGFRWLAATDI